MFAHSFIHVINEQVSLEEIQRLEIERKAKAARPAKPIQCIQIEEQVQRISCSLRNWLESHPFPAQARRALSALCEATTFEGDEVVYVKFV
jgi:hypothetical protein